MKRVVTLLLLDPERALLGALEPFEPIHPWWQELSDVQAHVRQRWALELSVLRLVETELARPPGGAVTYLAQLARSERTLPRLAAIAPELARRALEPHPLRAPWAEPDGPSTSIAWARRELAARGHRLLCAEQQRAWNLSAIWRLPCHDGSTFWLKQVPPFFAQESSVLRWLAQHAPGLTTPIVTADEQGRQLLADIPGADRYGCPAPERAAFGQQLHAVQRTALSELDALAQRGIPDLRGPGLASFIRRWLSTSGADLSAARPLLDTLEARIAALAACRLPDTLVHGDFHPGNVRSNGERSVILDWTDAFLGHPAFDILRLCEGCSESDAAPLIAAWSARWQTLEPASDPARAIQLARPLAALRNSAVYASFLAQIEPSEHEFHADHVPAWLALATKLDSA
ncbi:MAG: aminoglycoside phosphotransferase family protein [Polyangiaceae bacterium]